jgi:hypothetical protein
VLMKLLPSQCLAVFTGQKKIKQENSKIFK